MKNYFISMNFLLSMSFTKYLPFLYSVCFCISLTQSTQVLLFGCLLFIFSKPSSAYLYKSFPMLFNILSHAIKTLLLQFYTE